MINRVLYKNENWTIYVLKKKDPFSAAFFVLLYFKYMNKNQYLTA